MARTSTIPHRISIATGVLEKAWEDLQRIIPGLPNVAMNILDTDGRRHRHGHFAAGSWETRRKDGTGHEVAVSPYLFKTPERLLATLLHEAAHAILFAEDPERKEHHGGCSLKDGYYHLSIFRDKCEELGLECEMANRRYGFVHTAWPDTGVPGCYERVLSLLKTRMPLGAKPSGRKRSRKWNPRIRLDCQCETPRIIYAPRNAAMTGAIRCDVCQGVFEPPEHKARAGILIGAAHQ